MVVGTKDTAQDRIDATIQNSIILGNRSGVISPTLPTEGREYLVQSDELILTNSLTEGDPDDVFATTESVLTPSSGA